MNRPVLIKKGAEADLYLDEWHDRKVVFKKRVAKQYRPVELDEQIRTYRTIHEPQLMHDAKKAGVPTPIIYLVDVKKTTIIMEYVEGKQVKQLIDQMSKDQRRKIGFKIGQLVARLHEHSLIHGDLTTSNMIVDQSGKVFFLDFGLGEKNSEVEAKGVDLHLMKRALESTHFQFAADCFESTIDGYGSRLDRDELENILEKIKEIERRGRYVTKRKQ